MPIVVVAHTVVDPGAVVVHLEHTLLADPAVVRPRRLEPLTDPAVPWKRCLGLLVAGFGLGLVVWCSVLGERWVPILESRSGCCGGVGMFSGG